MFSSSRTRNELVQLFSKVPQHPTLDRIIQTMRTQDASVYLDPKAYFPNDEIPKDARATGAPWNNYIAVCELAKQSQRYLEIGSYKGWSLLAALHGNPNIHATCVDIFLPMYEDYHEDFKRFGPKFLLRQTRQFFPNSVPNMVIGDSKVVLPKLKEAGDKYDLILVDAAHDYDTAYKDVVNSWDLLVPGGWLVFDDANSDQCGMAFRDVIKDFKISEKHETEWGFGTVVIRKAK